GHPQLLSAQNNLAQAYSAVGSTDRAIELLESILPPLRAAVGPESTNALNAENSLSVAYRKVGRFADALPLLEHVVRARRDQLGLNHFATRLAEDHLAMLNVELGRPGEAKAILGERLRADAKEFPPGSPPATEAAVLMADLHARLGEFAAAEPI